MATTTVLVPINGSDKERDNWVYDLGAQIDASKDVVFVDANNPSQEVNIKKISCAANATLVQRGRGLTDASATSILYVAGGWHESPVGIAKVIASGSTTSAGVKVAI